MARRRAASGPGAVDRAGSGFVVTTDRGPVRAAAVLMATNGYTTPLFPWLKRRLIPLSSYLIATEDLPEGMADELFPTRRMCVETRNRHCYFRLSPDGRRVVLGGRAAMATAPVERTATVLRGLLEEIFPQLKGIGLTHSWTGHTGFSQTTLETRFWYRNRPWFLPFAHALYRLKDIRDDMRRAR